MDLMTEQRLARRAAILATAREMIAEIGYEAITVRDLASRCRVSVPTLYNQFGGKDEVLAAAIQEHFIGLLGATASGDSEPGFPTFLNILDECAQELVTLSAYHRRLLEAFASLDATAAVQQQIAGQFATIVAHQLNALQRKRQLAPWASVPLLAAQVTNAVIGTAVIWSAGHLHSGVLGPAMRYGAGLVLLGTVRGRTRAQLESIVIEAQGVLPEGIRLDKNAETITSEQAKEA